MGTEKHWSQHFKISEQQILEWKKKRFPSKGIPYPLDFEK